MTFRKKVFTSQKISIAIGNVEFRIQALVSTYGAKYVFEEADIPDELRYLLNEQVRVTYKNIPTRGRLIRETTSVGVIFHLRFEEPSKTLVNQIERDVAETGIPSPWVRALPRLSTDQKHLPVPVLAILHYRGQTLYLNVKNFTLGGLLLEYVGVELSQVAVGDKFEIDMVVNSGEKIADVSAIVKNISAENTDTPVSAHHYFGVKFLPMTMLNENKYRELIRAHCLGLKEDIERRIIRYS